MDFFIRDADSLIPVEVKANNVTMKSLNTLISKEEYSDIRRGIKLGDTNISSNNRFVTFPYALTFLLKRWIMAQISNKN